MLTKIGCSRDQLGTILRGLAQTYGDWRQTQEHTSKQEAEALAAGNAAAAAASAAAKQAAEARAQIALAGDGADSGGLTVDDAFNAIGAEFSDVSESTKRALTALVLAEAGKRRRPNAQRVQPY